jgi:uncharacterized membrane protein
MAALAWKETIESNRSSAWTSICIAAVMFVAAVIYAYVYFDDGFRTLLVGFGTYHYFTIFNALFFLFVGMALGERDSASMHARAVSLFL